MTRILQIIFATALILILVVWIVDIFIGTSATVSDIAVTEGWAEDLAKYEVEKIKFRFRTLYYAIPSILLLSLTIMP